MEEEKNLHAEEPGTESIMPIDTHGEAEDEPAIAVPPVPPPFYGLERQIAYFGFSQPGEYHIRFGVPCQDRCCSVYLPDKGLLISAQADGVGSCALSDLGAYTATSSAVEHIRGQLEAAAFTKLDKTLAGSVLRSAFQYAYDQVNLTAQRYEQLPYSLSSTLTVAIYDGTDLYFGHAGDDGIVALTKDRQLALATTRHKGETAASVCPLQNTSVWEFGMVPDTVAFVMATDGVLDSFVSTCFENNMVFYPFLEPIFTADYHTVDLVKENCLSLFSCMSGPKYRSKVTDDLTIAVFMNLPALSGSLPEFDTDLWNEQEREYRLKTQKVQRPEHPKAGQSPAQPASRQPRCKHCRFAGGRDKSAAAARSCSRRTRRIKGKPCGRSPRSVGGTSGTAKSGGEESDRRRNTPSSHRRTRRANRRRKLRLWLVLPMMLLGVLGLYFGKLQFVWLAALLLLFL